MNTPKIISGGIHKDDRGKISFVNDFDFQGIKRFYCLSDSTIHLKRAWQGHKIEEKYFFVTKGSFVIDAVKINDWINPSKNLVPQQFLLNDKKSEILFLPAGYANGITALEVNSSLIIYSNLKLEESIKDTFRFDASLWNS